MTYKTQKIIAKCLKQFDLRLFEEIGGNIQEKKTRLDEENKKKTPIELSLRELKKCLTLKVVSEMQSLQKPATTFIMKNGIQQRRNTPIIIPMVIAA